MARKLMTGNEAVAYGALHAGVKVITGYPGTPSSGALECLLSLQPENVCLEWSTNEKVAFEIAAGASWAGQRSMCTMKMTGLNVAFDSLISTAYSGCVGSLVIYVADDPGVSAGMAEQDSRGFAQMADLPMLEPATVAEAYSLTRAAFELSERVGTPVFVRLVTATASSLSMVQIDDDYAGPPVRKPVMVRDINRFTKAGSTICMQQHRDLIARFAQAGKVIEEMELNRLDLAPRKGGLGIVAAGAAAAYVEEGMEIAAQFGFDRTGVSILRIAAVHPYPARAVQTLLERCDTVLVLEELEPHVERSLYVQAQQVGYRGKIVGKLNGTFERVGEYGVQHVVRGIAAALELAAPADLLHGNADADELAAARPITVCAGCPHRGTFIAIDQAIRKSGLKRDAVIVTGDIGCTILGMNPPFDEMWTELSMGASIGLAMGFAHAGVQTPIIATIGDSTFFHAGLPALVDAVQNQVPLTLVIMDNGWTSMTGMQVNAGTDAEYQAAGNRAVDIAKVVPGLGVDQFFVIDPFDLDASTATIRKAIQLPGVKVVLARQECVLPALRRGRNAGRIRVIAENCNLCKLCIIDTGCPAISLGEEAIVIDSEQCYGCNLCGAVCNRNAIALEPAAEAAS